MRYDAVLFLIGPPAAVAIQQSVLLQVCPADTLAYHGGPRFTEDIDFLVAARPQNAKRLERVLERFGFAGLRHLDRVEKGLPLSIGKHTQTLSMGTWQRHEGW